ncbi:hypothetical protein CJP72_07545 [Citrobacter sp. NCU1]|uniref:Arm DNA-binding domain-containing protein n=1 Tax=Citrobacter sp. NCU1 TaxID=2026683 RepID=UPI0013913DD7|nr:Arm DNA-binding domain-containing protein [Citrobacter sp. NCU1]NDO80630.1 hypothetical protein [Citrobacter sp. NCU1]
MTVRNAKFKDKVYKLTDSNGLFLFISPTGSKLWRFRYRFENKDQTFSIGHYPKSIQNAMMFLNCSPAAGDNSAIPDIADH